MVPISAFKHNIFRSRRPRRQLHSTLWSKFIAESNGQCAVVGNVHGVNMDAMYWHLNSCYCGSCVHHIKHNTTNINAKLRQLHQLIYLLVLHQLISYIFPNLLSVGEEESEWLENGRRIEHGTSRTGVTRGGGSLEGGGDRRAAQARRIFSKEYFIHLKNIIVTWTEHKNIIEEYYRNMDGAIKYSKCLLKNIIVTRTEHKNIIEEYYRNMDGAQEYYRRILS